MPREKKSALQAEEIFAKTSLPSVIDGSITIYQMWKILDFIFGKREYQREKVATLEFKQSMMQTVLIGEFARIPEIHIRVISLGSGQFTYELVDGQQRITAVIDFLEGNYRLPKGMKVDDKDVGNFNAKQLKETYIDIYQKIKNYEVSCKFYENLDEEQTAYLFVEILNNTNDMKPQEIRNAISGLFSTWVRDTARGNEDKDIDPHKLFSFTVDEKGKKTLTLLPAWKLKGRMEVEEWLSELAYMWKKKWTLGITQKAHTQWVKDLQVPNGEYSAKFKDKSKLINLLDFSYNIINSVPKEYKTKLTPMLTHVLVLYGNDLQVHGKLNSVKYTNKFFEVYDKWSSLDKKLYEKETTINGNQMPPFKDLFGGRNQNAIGTIVKVLNKEFEKDNASFGVIKIDPRESFSKDDIYMKWKEQGMKDACNNEPLDLENAHGDHIIPRSAGIEAGGVTEYHNLQVISKENNLRKGNMDSEVFKKQVA